MIIFSERLKEYMDEKKLNAPALAAILNIDRSNITRYVKGQRTPNFKTFIDILNFFNCSADYMLGLIEYPPENVHYHAPNQPLNERLRYVLEYYGISQYSLDKKEDFSNSAVYYWLSGRKLPSLASLYDLAKSIECPLDFILGRID